jgi:hypothetical protein
MRSRAVIKRDVTDESMESSPVIGRLQERAPSAGGPQREREREFIPPEGIPQLDAKQRIGERAEGPVEPEAHQQTVQNRTTQSNLKGYRPK